MTTDWLGSPPERGIAFALHLSPLSIAVTCTSSAMDEQDKVSGKKFDSAPVAVDRCTSTCPEQDVRYPKPGIKEISGGESALYQYWHISELEYSSTGYIVCKPPCFRVCLLPSASISWRANSEEVTAGLGKNSAYATDATLSRLFLFGRSGL